MHESNYVGRRFDPDRPSGRELTIGSIGKLSGAVGEARALIARLDRDLADIDRRLIKLGGEGDARPIVRPEI